MEERNIIVDKESGKNLERDGYQLLKTKLLRAGDTLVIKELIDWAERKVILKGNWKNLKQ